MPRKPHPADEWNKAAKRVGMPSWLEHCRQLSRALQNSPASTCITKALELEEARQAGIIADRESRELIERPKRPKEPHRSQFTKEVLRIKRENPLFGAADICDFPEIIAIWESKHPPRITAGAKAAALDRRDERERRRKAIQAVLNRYWNPNK